MDRMWKEGERLREVGPSSLVPWIKDGRCPRCSAKMGAHMVREPSLRYCMTKACNWLTCSSCLLTYDTHKSRVMPLSSALEG